MTPCSATPGPVLRLGRPLGLPVSIHYVSEPPLGVLVLAPLELEVRQPQLQPDQELVRPQESLDPVLLPALGVEHQDHGRPVRPVVVRQALMCTRTGRKRLVTALLPPRERIR